MATIVFSTILDGKMNNAIANAAVVETLMARATADHSAPKN